MIILEEGLSSMPCHATPWPELEAERRAALERRRAVATAEAEDRARRDRWESLAVPAKEALYAEFERMFPRPPGRVLARLWEVQRRDWCEGRMDLVEACVAAGGGP